MSKGSGNERPSIDRGCHGPYSPHAPKASVIPHGFGAPSRLAPNAEAASSKHPGGANFAFADGSVKFLKEIIKTWTYDKITGIPLGLTGSPSSPYVLAPPDRFGVCQLLSTCGGGEVISVDAF